MAILIAATSLVLAVVELGRASSELGNPVAWVGYVVIFTWSGYIARSSEKGSALLLVLAQIAFWASLIVIEALYRVEVTAFDFVTGFGSVMMLGVLAGALAVESRMVWAVSIGTVVASWAACVGFFLGDPTDVLVVRAVTAIAGVVFTTALVSKLFDQLAYTIVQHDRSRRLQNAIAKCSEALLVQTDSLAIHAAVEAILEATDADYGYVDRTVEVDGGPGWEIIADTAKTAAGYGQAWRVGSYSAIPPLYESLVEGNAVVVHTSEMNGRMRELYEADGIRSEVSVPILVDGDFRGSIGFVQYTSDRRWHHNEIQTLWRAAHMIGAYWQQQDQADALRASNESKDRLLASVSHEIRTPLTAIVGLSEEIISSGKSLGDDELTELNSIIAAQSRELAELVEDLLVASRADFGNLSIRPESIDLLGQAELVVRGLEESHRTNKVIEVNGEVAEAWADPLRVRQILRNLLTNAIKYGGRRIAVVVRETEGIIRLIVSDDGPGIPVEEADLIFERYYRSAGSPTQPGSVGIGLAVSRQLAEMMGGSLVYVAEGPHHHFELCLPSAPDRRHVVRKAKANDDLAVGSV